MASRIAGILFFKVDGQQFQARGSFKIQPNSTKKTAVVGVDGVHGFKEDPIVPMIDGEKNLMALPGTSMATSTRAVSSAM